jgi:hypothetical protein
VRQLSQGTLPLIFTSLLSGEVETVTTISCSQLVIKYSQNDRGY